MEPIKESDRVVTPMQTTFIERLSMMTVIAMAKAHIASVDAAMTPNYVANMTREIAIVESMLDRFYTQS